MTPTASERRLGVMQKSVVNCGFCLKDTDIHALETSLDVKFSVIVSSIIPPTSQYSGKYCSLNKCTVDMLTNVSTLACITSDKWNSFLTLAAQAELKEPLSTFTVATPAVADHGEMFAQWSLIKELTQPWIWCKNSNGEVAQVRKPHQLRAYHAWAVPSSAPLMSPIATGEGPLFAIPGCAGLNLCFSSKIAGTRAEILTDTGAGGDYVSQAFCQTNGIAYVQLAEPQPLELGDRTSRAQIVGAQCLWSSKSGVHV